MPVAPEFLIRLQNRPELIRNICILAHVDHGKTSLSDNLLASNGIISQNLQGQIRYLDSRPDEQARGITMESSAISLYFKVLKKIADQDKPQAKEYLINLIDSPGHIDFSSEVSTASRLCDGAVVVVDVVEGVCSQTVTVLRQAWVERMKPILVLNKIDRLITELQMTALEAYTHLARLIEQVNAVIGSFYAGQRMEEDLNWRERLEKNANEEFVDSSDEDLYFAPEKNNVVFGSAIDGWGFNIAQFAAIYERKLGMNRSKLEKVLWGEFYYDAKSKSVVNNISKVKSKNPRPLFVQFVLDNIWAIYKNTVIEKSPETVEKIVNVLELKVQPRDIKAKDGKNLMHSIFSQWIPLSRAILLSVIDFLPSPLEAQRTRIPMILEATPGHESVSEKVVTAMKACDRTGPITSFISKVITVAAKDIPKERKAGGGIESAEDRIARIREQSRKARELALASGVGNGGDTDGLAAQLSATSLDEDDIATDSSNVDKAEECDERVIGFARVYSGTISVGQQVNLLNPRYSPEKPDEHVHTVTVSGLFLLMGRDMIPIDHAPAGNIVGIAGLDGKILKSGTIVSVKEGGPNLASTNVSAPPILRVAVEPVDPTKIPQLERGLRLLNISDPCVQTYVQENGEHILATAGELHLERCIKDLKERFAKVDITTSKPIVPYRETIVEDGEWKPENGDPRGLKRVTVGSVQLEFLVFPLSKEITEYISSKPDTIRGLADMRAAKQGTKENMVSSGMEEAVDEMDMGNVVRDESKLDEMKIHLDKQLEKIGYSTSQIVSFGPKRVGPNILFDKTGTISRRAFPQDEAARSAYEDNILTGFQMAMAKGPLIAEPLEGVGCVLVSLEDSSAVGETSGTIQGRLISATRETIHQGISDWSPRIKLATYLCDIQAPTDVLGKVYGVVTKRRGKILSEEMKEGTPFFTVHASLPVADAFGFSAEMRKRTSGAANPQLVFSGFELLDQDPYWVPTTEEELEELGETADRENIALAYVNAVRRRKGMAIDQKLVEFGERQRTMKK
ncbi:ribosome assembly protein 1 [Trichomonascus vanleenenianus]|uniref:GTPase RIA1 n=1 Tax=Trichomonascus vanleenenianus TaxID=2268995 RepID=UPI003ECA11C6